MTNTYSISEAQAKFPSLVREAADVPVAITRRDVVVGYLISTQRMEAIIETLEVLANPAAMQAIEAGEQGRSEYHTLDDLDAAEK